MPTQYYLKAVFSDVKNTNLKRIMLKRNSFSIFLLKIFHFWQHKRYLLILISNIVYNCFENSLRD